jgi:hypothetical protein
VTVHSPPPVTTGTLFPCPGAGTTARSAKENLNDAERAVVLRSELGIALLGALALNVAVQHSGDPLQDLVGEPGIVAPAIHAVVGGDVVYNQVHMMTAETDEKRREDWIASLDRIAALEPRIVVSGHKRLGAADDPKTIGESQQYLRDFSRVVASEQTVEGIVSAMLELHPDRDNPRVVWHSAREAVKKRQEA